MVHGIVTILDETHYLEVEELWREFERKFSVSLLSRRMPYPHISLHVAGEYDISRVEPALAAIARDCKPIKVRLGGLGIFTNSGPVLTLNVVRTPELDAIHRRVWNTVQNMTAGALTYYKPENWMPHITLAQGDLTDTKLPRLVTALANRKLDWEIEVNNITLMIDDGIKHDIRQRVDIGIVR